jgi:hypothetical protein
MNNISKIVFLLFFAVVTSASCKKDYGNLNNPTDENYLQNATKDQLNNLVSGTESAMRNNLGMYLDDAGVIGREIYRFSGADPRYTTDLLGASDATLNNTGFYIVNVWASKYRVVKNCNLLIEAAANSTVLTDAEKKSYSGFAKTIKAYEFLLLLSLTGNNGIRIDVANASQPGPIVAYEPALTAIAALLDEGKSELNGSVVPFTLSSGFAGLNTPAGLVRFNRAIAARVAVYRSKWPDALTYLNESFFDLNGAFNTGAYHVFSTGSGDQLSTAFFPQNQAGELRLAHPSYETDLTPGDDRIGKASLRSAPYSNTGLTGNRDVWVYTTPNTPVPIIRNEELILIYAEARIGNNSFPDAIVALNKIRTSHNLPVYAGAVTQTALINEMLRQRRYSLFFEGHRWIDLRRYQRLNTLPVDRPGDNVWNEFPLPSTEQ